MTSPIHKKFKMSDDKDDISSSDAGAAHTMDAKSMNKFSRQIAALGAETTAKLTKMQIIVMGVRGIGIETVKNLALQGVGGITIIDSNIATMKDTGVNFFILENDFDSSRKTTSTRAELVYDRVRELNPLCSFKIEEGITDELIRKHSALVITQPMVLDELIKLNDICRKHKCSFLYAFAGGVFGSIFVDHGDDHVVSDLNGEKPAQKLITEVISLPNGESLLRYDHPSGQLPLMLDDGVYDITEVIGIDNINGRNFQATHPYKDPVMTVRIPFDSSTCNYVSGGLIVEKKVPVAYPMHPLAYKIKNPGNTFAEPPSLVLTDLLNFGSELQQHVSWVATMTFLQENGYLPRANNDNDAAAVVTIAKDLLKKESISIEDFELDEKIVTRYALHAASELQPLSAFLGGVLAQEVVKCTGKYTPIPGFMHFHAMESLPDDRPSIDVCVERNNRNDELASVYGWPFLEKLSNLKYFMVGCGALGCEFMKNFALNNIFCGPQGKLHVTDADRIEVSNLTRQFLFREHNVGQPKSKAASIMANVMNNNFHVEALELFAGPNTENTFDDDFWINLDGVCNALDNMEARLYVDRQCVKYEKSLLESGTMGTSGNVDTICPFKTKTYSDGGKAVEGGDIPMCTLRNFPQITDHCIEWSRDQFELLFAKLSKKCSAYLQDPLAFEEDILGKSEKSIAIFETRLVIELLRALSNPCIGSAAQFAMNAFYFLFRDKLLDLQAAYPRDARIVDKNGDDKGPFWGEKKRYPTAAVFNPNDESHTSFLLSTTCLCAVTLGLIPPKEENDDRWLELYREKVFITNIAASLTTPSYISCPIAVEGDEHEEKNDKSDSDAGKDVLPSLLAELKVISSTIPVDTPLYCHEFEKDDDLNFHIAFITACANLRCDNYSIKRTDFHSTKVIAGKIIAAIATTTAAVCGLVMFEFFKLILEKPTDSYMNRQIGLATNAFTSFTQEPPNKYKTSTEKKAPDGLPIEAYDSKGNVKDEYVEVITKRAYPNDHSSWDKLVCSGSLTLQQFSDWLLNEHKLQMTSWDFIYGIKPNKGGPTTTPIYPPKVILNYSLLPSLDLSFPQATQAIMKNTACKPTAQYISLWKECKASGVIPEAPCADNVITSTTTLKDILLRVEAMGSEALASKAIESCLVTSIGNRKFWIIPSNNTPSCIDIEFGDDIEYLCALKIML